MKYKLFFLLFFCCLSLSAQLKICYGSYKQAINDSVFYNDDFQVKRNDSIVFYWPSIIGLVKVYELGRGDIKVECLYRSPSLTNQEIVSNEMVFCQLVLNESNNRFEIDIDTIAKVQSYKLANTYDTLRFNSKNIHTDSLLTVEDQFKYLKLVQGLSFGILNGEIQYFNKLNKFFVDFPFMQFNQLGQEILEFQNLGRVVFEYELYKQ